MKIGIYSPYLDTLTGGEKYILTMASCLSSSHQVSLLWDTDRPEEFKKKAESKLGIELSRITFAKNIFSPKVSTVSRLLKSRQYDTIIFLSDGSLPLIACKLFIHFQFPVQWVNGRTSKNQFKIRRAQKVICNSEFTKGYIDTTFGINSTVLYPPVDIKMDLGVKKENIILNVGRFGQHVEGAYFKKQDVLINAFKKMVDGGFKNWKLIFIISVSDTDKERFKSLQDLAKGYPIEFIVNPENKTLWETYSKAKIYWHASGFGEDLDKHPEKAEHFGISTVEAMGAGAVPVVIRAGGQKEIIHHKKNGMLWEGIDELIGYTYDIAENADVWEKMSEKAKERAQVFAGNRFCEELKKLI